MKFYKIERGVKTYLVRRPLIGEYFIEREEGDPPAAATAPRDCYRDQHGDMRDMIQCNSMAWEDWGRYDQQRQAAGFRPLFGPGAYEGCEDIVTDTVSIPTIIWDTDRQSFIQYIPTAESLDPSYTLPETRWAEERIARSEAVIIGHDTCRDIGDGDFSFVARWETELDEEGNLPCVTVLETERDMTIHNEVFDYFDADKHVIDEILFLDRCPECKGKVQHLGGESFFCLDCDWHNLKELS